jgi:uncharacterized coiled-coil DUF342 family protein
MTGEKLHSKSAIAAELGYRDMVIDKLKEELAELKANIPQGLAVIGHIHDEIIDSCESAEECRQEIINYSVTIRALTQAKEQ